jgi:hypothetical protein
MFFMLLKWLLPSLLMGVLCVLIWVQLILRLSGKTLRGWLPTFFAAVLLVVLGLINLFFWEIQTHQPTFHDGFAAGLGVRMAQGAIFSGAVYVGVTVWLYLFDQFLKRR